MTPRASVVVLALHAASFASAQSTIVVSGGGTALQTAINAAAPGDTLVVQPAAYAAVTCSKGLRLALQAGAQVGTGSGTGLTLTNLPPAERFLVDGGSIAGIAASGCAGTIVVDGVDVSSTTEQFAGCTGAIVFDTVRYLGSFTLSNGRVSFDTCAQVSFRDCLLPALTFTNSRALLQGCTVRPYIFSAPGVQLVSGSLTISGGLTTGSEAVFFSIARPGIQIDAGDLMLTGGAVVQALEYAGQTAPGVLVNGGAVRRDPGIAVTGTPPFSSLSSVFTAPTPSLTVATVATTLDVATRGQPGDLLVTFAGLLTAPYATPWGDAWLLPTDPILDVAVLPASGTAAFSRTFAAVPPFVELTLQPVALAPNGTLTIGAPTRFAWN